MTWGPAPSDPLSDMSGGGSLTSYYLGAAGGDPGTLQDFYGQAPDLQFDTGDGSLGGGDYGSYDPSQTPNITTSRDANGNLVFSGQGKYDSGIQPGRYVQGNAPTGSPFSTYGNTLPPLGAGGSGDSSGSRLPAVTGRGTGYGQLPNSVNPNAAAMAATPPATFRATSPGEYFGTPMVGPKPVGAPAQGIAAQMTQLPTQRTAPDAYWSMLNNFLSNPSSVAQLPGYQFQLEQGMQALNRTAGARRQRYSGRTLAEAEKFGQGLASTSYQQQMQNLLAAAQAEMSRYTGENQANLANFQGNVQNYAAQNAANAQNYQLQNQAENQRYQTMLDQWYKNNLLTMGAQGQGFNQQQQWLADQGAGTVAPRLAQLLSDQGY